MEIKVNKAYFLTFVNNHTARIIINIISHEDAPSLPVNNFVLLHVMKAACKYVEVLWSSSQLLKEEITSDIQKHKQTYGSSI